MIVRCLYDKLVPINELKKRFHPKNRNKHPKEQIERLAKILKYQGVRYCVKISNQSDLITTGHGRVLAAEFNGWTEFPVNYQDYDDEDQEYADVQADNAIASWAELDFAGINSDVGDLGPDFDIDLLGLQNFLIEPADKFIEKELLWDSEFEGPKENFRIVITVEHKNLIKKVLDLLEITSLKNYKDGKVISVKWPEINE